MVRLKKENFDHAKSSENNELNSQDGRLTREERSSYLSLVKNP